jgi:hypothetical protein
MAKEIELTKGKKALVDDSDFDWLIESKWHFTNTGYAGTNKLMSHGCETQTMHRAILDAPQGFDVDHINGNKLDNRPCNLRLATRRQNLLSKSKRKDSKMKYKGVMYVKPSATMLQPERKKPYLATIRMEGKRKFLGYFTTQEEAALAYNKAAMELHGEFARLNEV